MPTVTHAVMHHDHRQWLSEHDMWRCDIAAWQEELKKAVTDLKQIESALQEHGRVLQVHATAVRLRGQELATHEHALAVCAQGETGVELTSLAQVHDKEAATHTQQSSAHERIKRHHHAVMAQVRVLQKTVATPMQ
jgi:hypothetical protein